MCQRAGRCHSDRSPCSQVNACGLKGSPLLDRPGDGPRYAPPDRQSLHDLQEAERLTPEQLVTNRVARTVARDLLQLSRPRPRPDLRDLAEHFGVIP
jgi:hypothetical protein